MKHVFRYLQGYLRIRVWGYSPERFMNLCSSRGILLWDIKRREEGYEMYILLSGFFKLRPIVRKTGTRAVVLERYGFPFFIRRMRRRKVFALGFPACLAFLMAMSQFVWAIDFEGNHSLTDDVLLDFLVHNGVDYGTPRNSINIEELEAQLREQFDVITWASARMEGTKFVVKLKENDLAFPEEQEEESGWLGSDLVAARDGVVVSILTRQGVPQVTAGSQVHAGDVLVSGSIPVTADDGTVREYQYCRADADVEIFYGMQVREELPLTYEYKSYTGREKRAPFLAAGRRKWVFCLREPSYLRYDTVLDASQLKLLEGLYLPLYYGFQVYREYLPVESVYTREQAEAILQERFQENIAALEEKGVQIIQKDVTINTVGNTLVLEGRLKVQGRDGRSVPIQPQTPSSPEDPSGQE